MNINIYLYPPTFNKSSYKLTQCFKGMFYIHRNIMLAQKQIFRKKNHVVVASFIRIEWGRITHLFVALTWLHIMKTLQRLVRKENKQKNNKKQNNKTKKKKKNIINY